MAAHRGLALALAALLALAGFVDVTAAVKHHDFKTCAQSAFCKRNRARADRAAALAPTSFRSPYSLSSPTFDAGVFRADLHNALAVDARFSLEVRFQSDGVARVLVDEVDGLRQRYNESAKWSLVDSAPVSPLADAAAYTASVSAQSSSIKYGEGRLEVVIEHRPIKLTFLRDGQPHVVLNERALLNMEHYRERPADKPAEANPPDMQVQEAGQVDAADVLASVSADELPYPGFADVDEEGLWEETFGGKRDSKKRGPESLSLDITFPGYEHVFGIPEHSGPLSLRTTRGGNSNFSDPYRLYNLDVFEYEHDSPMALYGAIPLMHAARAGSAVGVFWLNAAETWIDIEKHATPKATHDAWRKTRAARFKAGASQPDAGPARQTTTTHWVSEAGVLDLFVFLGPSATDIHRQYASLTGTTAMPQLFAIGHHQCRWNYLSQDDVLEVSANFDKHDMPMDVIWLDIEYAEEHKYFVWDRANFPEPEKMQEGLTARGRQLVAIIDPHVKRTNDLYVYTEAKELDVLYKDADGNEFDGWCWTGSSAWVDFFNPKASSWWIGLYKFAKFKGSTRNLFVWNDMNEPSIFNGPEITAPKDNLHYGGWEHRDLHNINGMVYHAINAQALIERESPARRPFVLTRSFFAGSQRYGAAWTGDNLGTWEHLAVSLPMILANGVGGYAFTGADAGGFFGNPSTEMLVRWYQAAAFAPFFRAHAHIDTKRREPYLYDDPVRSHLRDALRLRYSLLPALYTAFWDSSRTGLPIARPHYLVLPDDADGFAIDDQYFVGDTGLLVHPVVTEGATDASVYFAGAQPYYGYLTGDLFAAGSRATVPAPLDTLPIFQRGGTIIPRRDLIRRSAVLMWRDPITLVVAVDESGERAAGTLYLDDGDSYAFDKGELVWRSFELARSDAGLVLRSTDLATMSSATANDAVSSPTAVASYKPRNAWAEKIADVPVSGLVVRGLASRPSCVRVQGSTQGLPFAWTDGLGADAARKKGGVGRKASELVIDHVGVKVVEDWSIDILFDGSDCATTSVAPEDVTLRNDGCAAGRFQCANAGHIPYCLLGSRVNDGICDPECCDGSDEFDGKVRCPNTCKEAGAAHRKQLDEEARKNRVGLKIRAEYVHFGQQEQKRLEANVLRFETEIVGAEEAEKRLKAVLEATESRQSEDIDRKKATGLYKRLQEYQSAIRSLRSQRSELETEIDELKALLTELREGWNPNSQDMVVKGIVRGFEDWARKRGIIPAEEGTEAPAVPAEDAPSGPSDDELESFDNDDPLALMDEVDESRVTLSGTSGPASSDRGLFRVEDYVPASWRPRYKEAVDALLDALHNFGILPSRTGTASSSGERADVTRARTAHQGAVTSLEGARKQLEDVKATLDKDWGPEWEWKKLEGVCVEKDTGEYTYELCLFKEGKQKSNKSHTSTSLGHFSSWHPTASAGSPEFYSKQVYDRGQQCWNGPERSIKLDIACGTSNALLSIVEPEKCEYLFKMTSPAACRPATGATTGKTEL